MTVVFWLLVAAVGSLLLIPDWLVTVVALLSLSLLFATYFMIGLPQ